MLAARHLARTRSAGAVRRAALATATVSPADVLHERLAPSDLLWETQFSAAISEVRGGRPYKDSADDLRKLIKRGLLKFTDITDRPHRFFAAHRLLAQRATKMGPGFWVRFTVQYVCLASLKRPLPANLNSLLLVGTTSSPAASSASGARRRCGRSTSISARERSGASA